MKPLLTLFRICIVLSVALIAMEFAKAQISDSNLPAWQTCAASPTTSCIAELVLSRMPTTSDDASIRRYLIHAGHRAQLGERLPADSSQDETTKANLRIAELAQHVRNALLEAEGNDSSMAELKGRLQAIDAELPPGLERHGQPVMRADIYLDTAQLMARGVWAGGWPAEGASFGWPEGVALRRHLARRFGSSLNAFVERARELAIQEKAWMSFAKAMAEIGRPDEARWAIRQLDFPSRSPSAWRDGCYSRVAAVMLDIGDFREADRIIGDAPCYQQRAEIAKRYAQNGEPSRAKEIAYELLARLPYYMQALGKLIDGPRLVDTVRPVVTALAQAGDRERALREMQEVERFARNEGRHLVSFVGASLGMAQAAEIYYELGEDAKADALIEDIAEHDRERHPSRSRPFAIAYAKCASGKSDCLDTLLSFSGETVDRQTGEQILAWTILAGRRDITADVIGRKFNIADAWLLNYGKLSFEVFSGDEDAAAQTLGMLIDRETHSTDRKPLLRCISLLRLAVAMERRDLAITAARVIVSRVFSETFGKELIGDDTQAQPAYRTRLLAETASVLAQLR